MSSKLFQGIVYQMREAVSQTIGVIDEKGTIIACSQLNRIGEQHKDIVDEISYNFDTAVIDGTTYKPIGTHARLEYIVFATGDDDNAKNIAGVLSVALTNLKMLYDEKYDKASFIKNIILDNILPGDIYIKAKELHFDSEISRCVYLIRFSNKSDVRPYDVIQNLFPDKNKDYVINISESDVVLVKEVRYVSEQRNLEAVAKTIVDTALSEFYLKVTSESALWSRT